MKKNNAPKHIFLFICLLIFAAACTKNNLYDKNMSLPNGLWHYGEAKHFTVEILDSACRYNLFVNVRHTDAYAFSNLWLSITTMLPDSSRMQNKVNVVLANPDGQWTGRCADGICYTTVLVQNDFMFPAKGEYVFSIEQDMRMNPLAEILDVGIKLEKL